MDHDSGPNANPGMPRKTQSPLHPKVSVIVPCFNEADTIEGLLDALYRQVGIAHLPQILVVDGGSSDGTRDMVKDYAAKHPGLDLRLVDNPKRTIPTALNLGLEVSEGDILIRLDAHSAPAPDYIARCLDVLAQTGAANVGGVWRIQPGADSWQARSIAAAAAHPFGAGDARYRISGGAGPVETVPFGAFRRSWLEQVGPFDERLQSNEDYEMNVRLRQAGGLVWFDPSIVSTYYARSTFGALARQYARYGYWKARMLLRYPGTLRWRQALPPLFVSSSLVLALLSLSSIVAARLLAVEWSVYGLALVGAGLQSAIARRRAGLLLGLPLALAIMHLAWGAAFWAGLVHGLLKQGSRQENAAT